MPPASPPRPPATLIERGATDARRALRGTLSAIVARAPAWHTGGPALLLVGDVAAGAEDARLAA